MKEEPTYDPWLDYEPPFKSPEEVRRRIDHDYVTVPTYRVWWDKHLASMAATAARWKAEAEREPQMRLPIPWFCRWMFFEATIAHYEELKKQIKP